MKDKRKEPRFKEEDKILILPDSLAEDPSEKEEYIAFMKDISIGGVKILTERSFSVDEQLRITLFLSNLKQPIQLRGVVKWISQDEMGGLFEMGIKFLHKNPEATLALMLHLYDKHIKDKVKNKNGA